MKAQSGDWKKLLWLLDQDGQTLPWMALLLVVLTGMGGLSTDLGRAYIAHRELQASTDAAALAGAYAMAQSTATASSVQAAVTNFSSAKGGANVSSALPNAQLVSATLKCLTSVALPCTATATNYNALQVTQAVTVPTYFIRVLSLFGVKTAQNLTVNATSTVAMRGALTAPWNVAIIIDTTASMGQQDKDASCNNSRIACALQGVRTLLQSLTPCTPETSGKGCTAFDQVSLFTYPNIEADTASQNGCPGGPKVLSYSVPVAGASWVKTVFTSKTPTYQLVDYSNDYSSTYSWDAALSTTSQLAIDAGAKSGCSGLQTPGGVQTYFAGAIYAAQSSLVKAQSDALAKNVVTNNAMIILSDGDANSTSITGATHNPKNNKNVIYGSLDNLCQQAILAASDATKAGTTVYSIAYGASSSGCSTDTTGTQPGISPCSTMRQLASSPATFYSDATASANPGQCISNSNPNLTLNNIFKQITYGLTLPRLIPNNSQ